MKHVDGVEGMFCVRLHCGLHKIDSAGLMALAQVIQLYIIQEHGAEDEQNRYCTRTVSKVGLVSVSRTHTFPLHPLPKKAHPKKPGKLFVHLICAFLHRDFTRPAIFFPGHVDIRFSGVYGSSYVSDLVAQLRRAGTS
jgi:hypothetical protein